MNMFYTATFAQLHEIPPSMATVSISSETPDWYYGWAYRPLAPRHWDDMDDEDAYISHFTKEVLMALNPITVAQDLYRLGCSRPVVLLVNDAADPLCHSRVVADWLTKAGFPCGIFE